MESGNLVSRKSFFCYFVKKLKNQSKRIQNSNVFEVKSNFRHVTDLTRNHVEPIVLLDMPGLAGWMKWSITEYMWPEWCGKLLECG